MWGKIVRSKSKHHDGYPSLDDESAVVLKNFRKIPSSQGSFTNGDEKCASVEEGLDNSCRCSPLLSFRKHFFGSLKHKKCEGTTTAVGIQDSVNSIEVQVPSLPCKEYANGIGSEREEKLQNHSVTKSEKGSAKERCRRNTTNAVMRLPEEDDEFSEAEDEDNLKSIDDESLAKMSPPMLKRREKIKSEEVPETRKSRKLLLLNQIESRDKCKNFPPCNDDALVWNYLQNNVHALANDNVFCQNSDSNCYKSTIPARERHLKEVEKIDILDLENNSNNHEERGHSSSDFDADDCCGKESGYITLDDMQTHWGDRTQSSCSSDGRCNDVGLGSCSSENTEFPDHNIVFCKAEINFVPRENMSSENLKEAFQNLSSKETTLRRSSVGSVSTKCIPADVEIPTLRDCIKSSVDCSAVQIDPNTCIVKCHESEDTSTEIVNKEARVVECCEPDIFLENYDDQLLMTKMPHNFRETSCCDEVCLSEASLNSRSNSYLSSDRDDDLPPLPARNYDDRAEFDLPHEQTHMSWEEVAKEAEALGIVLHTPDPCKRLSEIELSAHSKDPVVSFQTDELTWSELQMAKGTASSTIVWKHNERKESKHGSPFKKFKLHNFFSKKGKNPKEETSSGAVLAQEKVAQHPGTDIQKRDLPLIPPVSSDSPCSSLQYYSSSLPPADRPVNGYRVEWQTSPRTVSSSSRLVTDDWFSERSSLFLDDVPSGSTRHSNGRSSRTSNDMVVSDLWTSPENNADFIRSFSKLKDCGWYWGPLGWEDAEEKLDGKPDGSFLVRDSSDDRYILSLSFRSQNATHHTRIEHYKGMFSFYSQPKSHGASTIVDFIEKAMEHSLNGKFLYFLRPRAPGLPPASIQLLYPISRLRNMHSLQHQCRFAIVKCVRRDLIDRLPIPPRLKEYLKQTQYYVEGLEDSDSAHQYFSQVW